MILTNGTEFSGHFGWNGKRGIHLSISIFSGNVPVEWPEPFELPTENSGFCCQMVNGPDFSSFLGTLYFRCHRLLCDIDTIDTSIRQRDIYIFVVKSKQVISYPDGSWFGVAERHTIFSFPFGIAIPKPGSKPLLVSSRNAPGSVRSVA